MPDMNQHLDEGTIHAWLDQALPPDESARVEAHASACAACAARVAEARGLIAASSRILSSLDAVPAGVIPGREAGVDQLAALRARRQAASRRWWGDRRVLAAASLLLVAGVSSLVWRSSPDARSVTETPAVPAADVASPVATAPEAARPPAVGTGTRQARTEAMTPVPAPSPLRAATGGAADSASDTKVAASSAGERRRDASAVANEARQAAAPPPAIDSTRALSRAEVGANLQRQAPQQGAAQQRQSLDQQRVDSSRTAGAGVPAFATRERTAAASFSVSARILDPASPAGGCYALSALAPDDSGRLAASDTIVLLDMASPERGDPSWFLARRARGASEGGMRWRQIDSVTVELRSRTTRGDSSVVRFRISPRVGNEGGGRVVVGGLPAAPNPGDARAVWANKVRCP